MQPAVSSCFTMSAPQGTHCGLQSKSAWEASQCQFAVVTEQRRFNGKRTFAEG